MKCFIEDFRELDIDELLAVNGGYGSSSRSYGKGSGGGDDSNSSTTSDPISVNSPKTSWEVWDANKDGRNSSGEITRPHDPYRDATRNSGQYKAPSFVPDNTLTNGGKKDPAKEVDLELLPNSDNILPSGTDDVLTLPTDNVDVLPTDVPNVNGDVIPNDNNANCGNDDGVNIPEHQIPFDSDDYHCDIKAYNEAVDHGATNPGDWDGNVSSVDEIYNENYIGQGASTPQTNSYGYVFYDFDNDGIKDHMEYYETGTGSTYTVFQTDGISDTRQVVYDSNVDSNGSAYSGEATFVPIQ